MGSVYNCIYIMAEIANLQNVISELQNSFLDLSSKFNVADQSISALTSENVKLRADIELLKSVVNRQATTIATLDADIDDLGQYGRRENVVFTNLKVESGENPETQVINLCKDIGVDLDVADIAACHPLPTGTGKPRRIIARFYERSKAQKIFTNRRKTKEISPASKGKLAADKGKGFGILPNLTVKRGKFFAQVKNFNDTKKHEGCWVDTNTGKILLKVAGSQRGRVIRNTSDLTEIDPSFVPDVWYFCSAPNFPTHHDSSTPVSITILKF